MTGSRKGPHRTEFLMVRLTADEMSLFRSDAERSGETLSAAGRRRLLAGAGRPIITVNGVRVP